MKRYIGKTAYSVQTVIELVKRRQETFDVHFDYESVKDTLDLPADQSQPDADGLVQVYSDHTTQLLFIMNSKFAGGRMLLTPSSIINDGYFEVYCSGLLMKTPQLLGLFDEAKKGGKQFYRDDVSYLYRTNKLRLINKSTRVVDKATGRTERMTQDINIDGEDLQFTNFLKYECLKEELEIIVDF